MKYSALDRLVHRLVFGMPGLQLFAADLEKVAFASQFRSVSAERPIFISSLPRAGTTALLEVFATLPTIATHTYRDMPMVMAPLLWSRISGAFRLDGHRQERAHGDGVLIDFDSPEALEEVLWRAFWPDKYTRDRIALWTERDASDDARSFLIEHIHKVIRLRCSENKDVGRYVSKNNANIARLELIHRLFPEATVLVPFRRPIDHVASMMRQHRNFIELHAKDPFARRYMSDLGHYEFGSLHRPIAFPKLDELTGGRDPSSPDYWLGYWIAAFEYVLANRTKVTLLPYERLCSDALSCLTHLCEFLELPTGPALPTTAQLLRPPPATSSGMLDFDPCLYARSTALNDALRDVCGF